MLNTDITYTILKLFEDGNWSIPVSFQLQPVDTTEQTYALWDVIVSGRYNAYAHKSASGVLRVFIIKQKSASPLKTMTFLDELDDVFFEKRVNSLIFERSSYTKQNKKSTVNETDLMVEYSIPFKYL